MKTTHILAAVAVASCVGLVVMNRKCQTQCHADTQVVDQAEVAQIDVGRDVILQTTGTDKEQTAAALRSLLPALSPEDATNMVNNTPAVIAKAVSDQEANTIKAALDAVGAQVVVS